MKNKFLTLIVCVLASGVSLAQNLIDKQNTRSGENLEYCLQHKKMNELAISNPVLYQQYLATRAAEEAKKTSNNIEKSGVVYIIPVVFHVLHKGGVENISMAQIKSAMDVLNRDYRRLNADANTVQTPFVGMPSDIEIEFRLATKAPNGACFSGVTRTFSALTSNGSDGENQVAAVVNGNDVYQGQWPPNKYMNVYVCEEIGGAAGYTHKPGFGAGSMYYNGIFVQHTYTGNVGTSSEYTGRTLTHEVGHWLNLSHTWGDGNNPGQGSSCGVDDFVQDTPLCIGLESCNLLANTCNDVGSSFSSWTYDVVDNTENYMDYSYCSKMFTPGQKSRMRSALTSSVSGRNNLYTPANLLATGAGGASLCRTEFTTPKTTLCAGESIQFTDQTFNGATGWTWSFPGGTPSTSTAQNPSVTYSSPGVYQVTLLATDGSTSDSEIKTNYIKVLNSSASLPFFEGFEGYTTLVGSTVWGVENAGNNAAFEITNTAAHTGTKSVKLANFNQATGNIDELVSSAVNLSGVSSNNITLSFRYAYRKKNTTDFEYLKVLFSSDCGTTWNQKKTLAGPTLGNITAASAWTPTSADWVTVHVTSSAFTAPFMNPNFRYKFRFESGAGNNIYIDDINIYKGSPSENIVLGVEEVSNSLNSLELFPNPSSDDVNVRFSVENNQEIDLIITDLTGKLISNQKLNAISGDNLILIDAMSYAKGLYLITLKSQGAQQSLQFIKQ